MTHAYRYESVHEGSRRLRSRPRDGDGRAAGISIREMSPDGVGPQPGVTSLR